MVRDDTAVVLLQVIGGQVLLETHSPQAALRLTHTGKCGDSRLRHRISLFCPPSPALVLLGMGWNFAFVGGGTIAGRKPTVPAEHDQVQALSEGDRLSDSVALREPWRGLAV